MVRWLAIPIALGVFTAIVVSIARAASARRLVRRRFGRARRAELRAAELLKHKGYRILAVQPAWPVQFRVGRNWVSSTVRADYLVSRWLRRYVIEVKSGRHAPDPASRTTRRQLREYSAVFPYPLLLLDAESGALAEVRFPEQDSCFAISRMARFAAVIAAWSILSLLFGTPVHGEWRSGQDLGRRHVFHAAAAAFGEPLVSCLKSDEAGR